MAALKIPDLAALKANDQVAWDDAYDWLWPELYGASHARLGITFPAEVEEVAIESFEEIYEQRAGLKSVESMPALARDIADKRAINRFEKLTAKKRDARKVQSLNVTVQNDEGEERPKLDPPSETPRLSDLDLKDIRCIIKTLEAELKAEHKQALSDFFLKGLRYEEISQNRGWPIGNVGAYIKRGLETMRKQRLKYPELVKAAMQYLTMIFA